MSIVKNIIAGGLSVLISAAVLTSLSSCSQKEAVSVTPETKVWAWMSGKTTTPDRRWRRSFRKASRAGINAVLLECHGGYPEILGDSSSFRDSAAIRIIRSALPHAERYGIELHAWIWTINRTEKNLRKAHSEWYQVNALGESCADIKLYNREHYRWLCPSRKETEEYLRNRVAELAEIRGLAGVHLDFIRYPDAILPYGLHESRGVFQDKVYPRWDFCYCEVCRDAFRERTGTDPLELEDPTSCEAWMQYRWDALTNVANALGKEIRSHGKIASAAVFASPEESKKLVRQDWANFRNFDVLFPMIYHRFYNWPDEMVGTATRQGVRALERNDNPASLCSGLFVGHVPKQRISEFFDDARDNGSTGICLFSLEKIDEKWGYWRALRKAIRRFRE